MLVPFALSQAGNWDGTELRGIAVRLSEPAESSVTATVIHSVQFLAAPS